MVLSLLTTTVLFLLHFLLLGSYVEAREYAIKADRICKFRKGKTLEQNVLKVVKLGNSTDFVDLCTRKCDKNELCKGFQVFGRECSLVRNDVKGFETPRDNNTKNKNNKNKRRLGEAKDQNEEDKENKNNGKENEVDREYQNNGKEKKNKDKEADNTDIVNKNTDKEKEGTNDENRSENRIYTCGMLVEIASPTVSPSVSISPTESHSKVFEFNEDTRCKVSKGETKKQYVHENLSRKECDNACGHMKKCKAYSWNSNKSECILFHFRVKGLKRNRSGFVCARMPKKTKATVPPTSYPTASPTGKLKCTISAELKFPFVDTEDGAPYYGHHADWLEVTKKNYRNTYPCSSYYDYINDLPGWCTYKNFDKNGKEGDGDSAYVNNLQDQYYEQYYLDQEERIDSEFVKIKDAYDHVTIIESYHFLFDTDYYPDDESWNDHMMVPELTIRNLSNDKQDVIGKILQHPAEKNESTHIKKNGNWEGNPKYTGNMRVEIHCNKFCRCEQREYEEFNKFYEY